MWHALLLRAKVIVITRMQKLLLSFYWDVQKSTNKIDV